MKLAQRKIGPNIVLEVLENRLGADKAVAFKDAVGRHLAAGPASPSSIYQKLTLSTVVDWARFFPSSSACRRAVN